MISKLIIAASATTLLMAFGANAGQEPSLEIPEQYLDTNWAVFDINGTVQMDEDATIITFTGDYIHINQGCYSFLAWPQAHGEMKVQLIEPFVACQMPMNDQQTAVYDIFDHATAFIQTGSSSFRIETNGKDSLMASYLPRDRYRPGTPPNGATNDQSNIEEK